MAEKRIELDEQFYKSDFAKTIRGICPVLDRPCMLGDTPCTLLDGPCSDTPCSDRPCSDSPCTDSPSSSASLSLTGGNGTLRWTISGLGNPFNTSNYVRVGITRDRFTVGGVSSISGIADYKNAPSSGSSTSVSQTIDYPPGTYTFWGFAETPRAGYWPAGSATVTVLPAYTDFQWSYVGRNPITGSPVAGTRKQSGLGVYVTADEWNALVANVNDRLGRSFSNVSRNQPISASTINAIASALGVRNVESEVYMPASFFNQLMDAVNRL